MRMPDPPGLFPSLCVICLSLVATAFATPDPWGGHSVDDAYSTDQIVLVDTVSDQGYTGEYYENRVYTCGRTGYQTFLIVYPDGLPLTVERPLWVRMHGGGVGAFDASGNYVPASFLGANDQESITKLAGLMSESGLMAKIRAHPAGFRFLMPSLCDHDVYSGVGVPDLNNPYSPDENGHTRAADGLLATKAAIAFARRRVRTSHTFLHGTSAGSIGTFSVAYSFDREGRVLAGIVSDSHVLGQGINDNADLFCMPFPYDRNLLLPKIGPLASSDFYPEDIVASGSIRVPIYHLWNRGDGACCGSALQTYTDPFGQTYAEPGCEHEHRPFHDAVTANPPGGPGRSVSVEVCVNDLGTTTPGACNLHSPTKYAYSRADPPGDQLTGGADYNQAILDWVNRRLAESYAVTCPLAPAPHCLVAAQAKLRSNEKKAGREKLSLSWKRIAGTTTRADFGDPVSGNTSVALCIYDDAGGLVEQFAVDRARQTCSGRSCWNAKGGRGYEYRDKESSAAGISKLLFLSAAAGKGRADAKGKNNAGKGQVALPTQVASLLAGQTTVTIQMLTSDGLCLGATMNTVKKDTGSVYVARHR